MARRGERPSAWAAFSRVMVGGVASIVIAGAAVLAAKFLISTLEVGATEVLGLVGAISFIAAALSFSRLSENELNYRYLGRRFSRLMNTDLARFLDGTNSIEIAIRPSKPYVMEKDEAISHLDDLKPPRHKDRALKLYIRFDTKHLKDRATQDYRQKNLDMMIEYIIDYYRDELAGDNAPFPGMSVYYVLLDQGLFKCVLPHFYDDVLEEFLSDPVLMQDWHDHQRRAYSNETPADILQSTSNSNVLESRYFMPIVSRAEKFLHVLEGSELLAEFASAYARWRTSSPNNSSSIVTTQNELEIEDAPFSSFLYHLADEPLGPKRHRLSKTERGVASL